MKPRPQAYQRPGRDSPKAKANTILLLVGARRSQLDRFTPEWLAGKYELTVETAADLLQRARGQE
jgi:hypothetical protein